MERYLRVNLLAPGSRPMKTRFYRAAVVQRLRNTGIGDWVCLRGALKTSEERRSSWEIERPLLSCLDASDKAVQASTDRCHWKWLWENVRYSDGWMSDTVTVECQIQWRPNVRYSDGWMSDTVTAECQIEWRLNVRYSDGRMSDTVTDECQIQWRLNVR